MNYESESEKGRKALLEARAHMRHAMELLGREGSTAHFLKLISKRNAALWRWKHTQGGKPTTTEAWI